MKRKWIAATAVACALTASISLCSLPALGESLSIGKDTTVVSTLKDATGNKILDSDAVSLIPENTTYHYMNQELNLILTNLSGQPLTFIKEGRLELTEKERWVILPQVTPLPAHRSPFQISSGPEEMDPYTVQPGQSVKICMRIGQYAPLKAPQKSLFHKESQNTPYFTPGEYRAVLGFQRADGTTFQWGSRTFRLVEDEVLASSEVITAKTTHTSYDGTAKTILLKLSNYTTRTMTYGAAFILQRQTAGGWTKLTNGSGFGDVGYDLVPGETNCTVNLDGYATLSPGVYRILKEFDSYVAAANFTVSNPGLAPKLPNAVSMEIFWPDKISGGKTYQFTEADVYEEQPAPQGILHELLAFQSCVTPLNISKEDAVEIKLINKGGQSVTANLIGNSRTSYIQVGSNWYSTEDSGVLSRIKALIDGV